jgi:pyrimidine operon attenuation protein/uracil phosphoribosyltransferase
MERSRRSRRAQSVMDGNLLGRALNRLASEILKHHGDVQHMVLVGIRSRGVPLARRLAHLIKKRVGIEPPVGALDITLYRDDLTLVASRPVLKSTEIPVSIDGLVVLLVDDVLFTGRTVRAALDELIDFGRPARIELAVLVDRGHRELPILADYVGKTIPTQREDIVQVMLAEEDGEDGVTIVERSRPAKSKPAAGNRARSTAARPRRSR